MIHQEQCKIIENRKIAPDYFKLTLSSKDISKNAVPGQFVHIKISNTLIPILRRPFSFHKIRKDHFEIIYHVVGKGTEIFSKRKKEEFINVIGPLGNGFEIIKNKIAILIGGGCGTAPLFALEEELKKRGIESRFFMGAKTKDLLLCQNDFAKIGTKVYTSTDDGSCGEKCTVLDLYIWSLKEISAKKSAIYACGPKEMLKEVSKFAIRKKIPCQISLEEHMACGVGACSGCVVKKDFEYKRVCKDGPVFDAREVIWE